MDAKQAAQQIASLGLVAPAKADIALGRAAVEYQGKVTLKAPYDTGNYSRSINAARVTSSPMVPRWSVGTNMPQGPRLEYGFVGTDSAGRTYNQRPQPHFRPNLKFVGPALERELKKMLGA